MKNKKIVNCHLHGCDLKKGIAETLTGYPLDEILTMNSLFTFNGIYEILGCMPMSESNEGNKVDFCHKCKTLANDFSDLIKKRWKPEQEVYDRLESEFYEEDQR